MNVELFLKILLGDDGAVEDYIRMNSYVELTVSGLREVLDKYDAAMKERDGNDNKM